MDNYTFIFVMILWIVIILIFGYLFNRTFVETSKNNDILRMFYNAISNIQKMMKYGTPGNDKFIFDQINLNYNKLYQECPNKYTNVLDLLETIIYYYDSRSTNTFENIFKQGKNKEVREFMGYFCFYIKKNNPFISLPPKESRLMKSIKDALNNNNEKLGLDLLDQLSQEIEYKEKLIIKNNKVNKRSYLISIVGLVVTIFSFVITIIISVF